MSVLKKVTKCDICGKIDCDLDGRLKIKQRTSLWWESWMTRFDVCPSCANKMKEWIRNQVMEPPKPLTTVTKAFGIGRNTVIDELRAQIAVGNLKEEVARDIIAHLFKEKQNDTIKSD
ncbi:MAG: hypothetical protein J6U54_16085 [Clostridiales bacterium]|nr:hypothetical protein [Clostridiales bacterium]